MGRFLIPIVRVAVLIAVILLGGMLWSLVAPLQPLTVMETETKTLEYDGGGFSVDMPDEYVQLPVLRMGLSEWMLRCMDGDPVAEQIAEHVKGLGLDELDTLTAAQRIVYRNVLYEPDGMFDHWQLPWETLARGYGDCEDFSILLGSILRNLGYDIVVIKEDGHVFLGVALEDYHGRYWVDHDGKRYYTLEPQGTTYPGYKVVADPESVVGECDLWKNKLFIGFAVGMILIGMIVIFAKADD